MINPDERVQVHKEDDHNAPWFYVKIKSGEDIGFRADTSTFGTIKLGVAHRLPGTSAGHSLTKEEAFALIDAMLMALDDKQERYT